MLGAVAVAVFLLFLLFAGVPQMEPYRGGENASRYTLPEHNRVQGTVRPEVVASIMLAEPVLILGIDGAAVGRAQEILDRRYSGHLVVGFVGDEPVDVRPRHAAQGRN